MKHHTDSDYSQQQAYRGAHDLDVRSLILSEYRVYSQSWYSWLYEQLELPGNGRILELGCGPADLWQQNEAALPASCHLYLSDLSAGMAQETQKRLSGSVTSYSLAVLDAASLPFPDTTFAVVLAFGLLDLLPDSQQALAETRRVLRPGGTFYTSTGDHSHLQELEQLVRPILPDANYGGDPDRFGLQNGAAILAPFYCEVEQRPYENQLAFYEADPLLAYILSESKVRQHLSAGQWKALQNRVEQALGSQREVRVTVNKGLFIGRVPNEK